MEVGLLGPLEVVGPDGRVRIGGAKERLVLALLVLRAGEAVSRDALVDAVWGDDLPATAVKTLQGYVARVRRALEAVGMAEVLTTREPGYVLCVPVESIDVTGFERHATAGRGALVDGDPARASAELGEARGLWRGDALADCRGGGWAAAEAAPRRRSAPTPGLTATPIRSSASRQPAPRSKRRRSCSARTATPAGPCPPGSGAQSTRRCDDCAAAVPHRSPSPASTKAADSTETLSCADCGRS